MFTPHAGDILIRGTSGHSYELLDAMTLKRLAGPFAGYTAAVTHARVLAQFDLWQQNVDGRGRALGEPFRLTHTMVPARRRSAG